MLQSILGHTVHYNIQYLLNNITPSAHFQFIDDPVKSCKSEDIPELPDHLECDHDVLKCFQFSQSDLFMSLTKILTFCQGSYIEYMHDSLREYDCVILLSMLN